jgi:tetratricopeptide (TPR) repeat protein
MARLLVVTGLAASLFVAVPVRGDDWPGAVPVDLTSPAGGWQARVTPGRLGPGDHALAPSAESATAELVGPDGERAVIHLPHPVMPVDALLLADGTLIAFDNWHAKGHGAAVSCTTASGVVRWRRELEELLPQTLLARVPTSVSSRHWRRYPGETVLEAAEDEAPNALVVTLWNEDRLRIDLGSGAATLLPAQVGEDPARLVARGEDLIEQRRCGEGLELLSRAVALAPAEPWHWLRLAMGQGRCEEPAGKAATLETAVERHWSAAVEAEVAAHRTFDLHTFTWLLVELGRAREDLGHRRDAEAAYRRAFALQPQWIPLEGLLRILRELSREVEIDALVTAWVDVARAEADDYRRDLELTSRARDAGDWYLSSGRPEAALPFLAIVAGSAHPWPSDFERLARVYESLDRPAEALVQLERLEALAGTPSAWFDPPALAARIAVLRARLAPASHPP